MGTTDGDAIESVGDRIARLRRTKGWNQEELGKRIGATGGQISKYERGEIPRSWLFLARLAGEEGVDINRLLLGEAQRGTEDGGNGNGRHEEVQRAGGAQPAENRRG